MIQKIGLFVFAYFLITSSQTILAIAKKERVFWLIYFKNVKKKTVVLRCEVARTLKEKSRGLMFRNRLEKDHGMIFVYDRPKIVHFWMRHTKIPLSIAFVNQKEYITEIYPMKPYDEKIISSNMKVLYAIEAEKGWFRKNFIFARSKIRIIKD